MNVEPRPDAASLLERAAGGDLDAWGALLAQNAERLRRVASFRLSPQLRGRIDAADVLQETFVAATERRAEFFQEPGRSLFLWLRWMVENTLLDLHRHHLDAQMRDPRREQPFGGGEVTDATRDALAAQLTCGVTGPATAARRAELYARLTEALNQMDPTDREVLALRHYEQLTSAETAQVLGIQERAAAKRYGRALERLRELLSEMPGGLTEFRT
ncbi:MAG TPA: sigma-70 family RNA polymerase sigma factor [Tepidisphaeraceae bacterium]|nr:sigma-70 family RNA polymerase sigma factor [Tepidisphaeraceae bacterium]